MAVPAQEVFTALTDAGVDGSSISGVQRQSSGEIVLTSHRQEYKERFLQHNVINLHGMPFALQDVD